MNAGAIAALIAALVSLNAMGALFSDEDLSGEGPLIAAPGPLDLPRSLPGLPGDGGDRDADRDAGGGDANGAAAPPAGSDAGGDAADPSRGTGGPAVVGEVVDRQTTPGRVTPSSPADQETVASLDAAPATGVPVVAAVPEVRVDPPAAGDVPAATPPPAKPPAAERRPLRLQVLSMERTTSRVSGDRLDVTLSATREESNEPAHVMSMQVAMPEVGRRSVDGQETLRLELAMLGGATDGAADGGALALRVRVSLADSDVSETTVARTGAADGEASDTLHLLVPLAGPPTPPPPVPVPVPEPPTEAPEPPPTTDTTIPVDVVVPMTPESASGPQTVELPSATPATGAAPEVTVDVTQTTTPPAPPAEPPDTPPAPTVDPQEPTPPADPATPPADPATPPADPGAPPA